MIATSLEQSKRLLELGIDIKTADMIITNNVSQNGTVDGTNVSYYVKSDTSSFLISAPEIIPAWSLSALLELMPKQQEIDIDISFGGYTFDGDFVNKWFITFETGSTSHIVNSYNIIDAAVEMIEWLLKNRYLGKEAEK